jgi:hypothetical protein
MKFLITPASRNRNISIQPLLFTEDVQDKDFREESTIWIVRNVR